MKSTTNNGGNGVLMTGSTDGTLSVTTLQRIGIHACGAATKITIADSVSTNNTYDVAANGGIVMVRNSPFSNIWSESPPTKMAWCVLVSRPSPQMPHRMRAHLHLGRCKKGQGQLRLTLAALLGIMVTTGLLPNSALAQAARSYVSGTGKDSAFCTVSSPCRTLQTALTATAPEGEIYVLDSADYGPATINTSVTLTSEGAIARILAASGVGLTISAGASDVVNLRGLDIDGGGSSGVGIQFTSGQALIVQKSVVRGFTSTGISFAPVGTSSLFVSDTVVVNNGSMGILVGGSGAAGGVLSRITAIGNGVGVLASGPNVNITITDTVAGGNNYGIGASASVVMLRNSTLSNNAVGISADQSSVVRVDGATVTANGTGWQANNGGQVQSYGNNNVSGNSTDGTPTTTVVLQ